MESKILAVTGGIAEGKSTLVDFLSTFGLKTWSADAVVRELWTHPNIAKGALSRLDLALDSTPGDVRHLILNSTVARRALNEFFHPLVIESMEASRAHVYEVPLLFETCIQGFFQRVFVVECGREEQVARLALRGLDEAQSDLILNSQLPTRVKTSFADQVFRTNLEPLSVRDEATKVVRTDPLLQEVIDATR